MYWFQIDAAGSEILRVTTFSFGLLNQLRKKKGRRILFCVLQNTSREPLPMSMLATTKKHFIPLVFPSVMSLSFVKLSENPARTWLIARRDDAAARGDEETQPHSAMCTAHCRRLANECDHKINVVGFESMTCNLAGWLHASPRWCVRKCFRRKKKQQKTKRRQLVERAGEWV